MRVSAMEHYIPHYSHHQRHTRGAYKPGNVRLAAVFVESGTARLISEEEALNFPTNEAFRRPTRASRRLVKHLEPKGHRRVRSRWCDPGVLRGKVKGHLVRNLLIYLTLIGVALGLGIGFALRPVTPSQSVLVWLGFPGHLFLRLLEMMIIPLVLTSLVSGTASLDVRSCGWIGLAGFIFIIFTNIIGTIIGLTLALLLTPGYDLDNKSSAFKVLTSRSTQDILADFLRNVIPENLVLASMRQTQTAYLTTELNPAINLTDGMPPETITILTPVLSYVESTNIMGLACFAVLVGIATNVSGDTGKPFLVTVRALTEVIFIIMRWILWAAPLGIASLIAASVASVGEVEPPFIKLSLLVVTVLLGLVLQQVVLYPCLYAVFTRSNPLLLYKDLATAWGVSFASASMAIAMPEIFKGLDNHDVDKRVSRFLVPLGVSTSASGSVCFMAIGVLFIAQMEGMALDIGQILCVGLLTSLAALALPAVPGASLVILFVILRSLGIPAHNVGLLFIVDWLLDKLRTTSNVLGTAVCAAVTSHVCSRQLQLLDAREVDEIESTPDTGTTDLTDAGCMTDVKELA